MHDCYLNSTPHLDWLRLNQNALSAEAQLRFEALLDAAAQLERIKEREACLVEARGQFPDEDFLQSVIDGMNRLAKTLRGANRDILLELEAQLESIAIDTRNSSEHGISEINKALEVEA